MARPRGRSFREVDELATRPAPKSERPLDDRDDTLDELASDESEDPARWEAFWSNWS